MPPGPLPSAAPVEEASRFAETLAASCATALGPAVAGVILHGSLTLDDYVPGHSDVDLLVVVDDPLTDMQVAAFTEAAERQRPRAPGRVDLRVVTRQVAASPTLAPPMELSIELTAGSGLAVERRHPGERDLVVELSMCRAHGRSLLGAAPAELIGEVPARWVVAVGDAQLADWEAIGDDPRHAALTVLTTCRIWRLAEEGATAPRPRPASGRSGVIPRSRWSVPPSGGATVTGQPGSTPRRSPSSWRWSAPAWPSDASAPRGGTGRPRRSAGR